MKRNKVRLPVTIRKLVFVTVIYDNSLTLSLTSVIISPVVRTFTPKSYDMSLDRFENISPPPVLFFFPPLLCTQLIITHVQTPNTPQIPTYISTQTHLYTHIQPPAPKDSSFTFQLATTRANQKEILTTHCPNDTVDESQLSKIGCFHCITLSPSPVPP